MSDPREQIQDEARQAWLNSNRKNTLILPTGSGKSKVAIDLIKQLNPQSILLLTNSQELRDNNWKAEFAKWGYPWEKVQSECYQTMYKRGGYWDLIVMDEIDFACTEEFGKVFIGLQCDKLLGLTGFIPEEKQQFLEYFAPICYKAHIEDLQQKNILNKSEFIIVEFPLSLDKTIEQKMKKGGTFFTSENDQYKYWDKQFQQASIIKGNIERKLRLQSKTYTESKEWQSADWKFKINATKRKAILNNLQSSITVTKNLIQHIHNQEGNKIIVFSAVTKQSDKLPNPFHGKTVEDVSGIEKLNSGEINTLSVCKKINRGVNLVGVNYIIRESFDSSETDFLQIHGRLMRLKPDQTAKYIILVPLYRDLVKQPSGRMEYSLLQTQAEKWKNKMLDTLHSPNVRIIRLDRDYVIKDGISI